MEQSEDRVSRIDLLLLLLYASTKNQENQPVDGMTRLQKMLFLLQRDLKTASKLEGRYAFRPYTHGPFCKEIYYDLDWLEGEGVVDIRPTEDKGRIISHVFKLTPKGAAEVKKMIANPKYQSLLRAVEEIRNKYNSIPLRELVDFVHTAFPDYKY